MGDQTRILLTVGEVTRATRLSKPTIYKMLKRGDFPQQVRIGTSKVAWLQSEVNNWIDGRAAARRSA